MSHTAYIEAVNMRLSNRLDDCADKAERTWRGGHQTPAMAVLRGNLNLDLGLYHDADRWYQLAWGMVAPNNIVKPEYARDFQSVALAYATSRMRLGYWDQFTWSLWEIGRIAKSWHVAPGTRPWAGQPEKVLILAEGGFGDAFLYTRLFQRLEPVQRAASRFVMGPHFASLEGFRPRWDGVETIWPRQLFEWGSFKYSTALMSLLSTTGIKSPADIPPPESGIGERSSIEKNGKRRYGICWRAEEIGVQKRTRSIDRAEDFEPLAGFTFYNLCPDTHALPEGAAPRLVNTELSSWADTAKLIAGLDCVVSVDSAVLHLAGLLNVPAIAILPLSVDWKFGTQGEGCIWWKSVTLIRNTSPYNFRPALEKAAALLEKL